MPLNVVSGSARIGNRNIYSNINVSNDGILDFAAKNTLKSGVTLRIGDKPTTGE